MDSSFQIPADLIGRFAVVKLWPGIKAAEDENVARLKVTAKSLGLECVEITPDGRLLDEPHTRLTQADIDFVIHLHFETPKTYDIFSFVALWNPVRFYHEWGYRRFSRHLLTHDDFLSCSSTGTDDHISRMIASDPARQGPLFTMYHSLSEPILAPTLGDRKIFYAGINWERLGKGKGRHQDLLDGLDPTGHIRIFGPKLFQGVDVWEGYQSYSGPIPFDGVSILKEINRAGIALVLSSDAHKQSELMSNRLFESLAAGAFVIADENPFSRRHFGDTLLYIDTTLPTPDVLETVAKHVQWIKDHPEEALAMAKRAQAIFLERFSLDRSLIAIYNGLQQRRQQLRSQYAPKQTDRTVEMFMLMPEFDSEVIHRHICNLKAQRYPAIQAALLLNGFDIQEHGEEIQKIIADAGVTLPLRAAQFVELNDQGKFRRRRTIGQVMSEALADVNPDHLLAFVAPDEELFSEHVEALVGALERKPEAAMAFSNLLYRHRHEGKVLHDLQEELDTITNPSHRPVGFARFLFRRSAFAAHIHSALKYVDAKSIALLVAACAKRAGTGRATVTCDIQSKFNLAFSTELAQELEVMRDYCPNLAGDGSATRLPHDHWEPTSLSLNRLSDSNRKILAVDLAHAVPIPSTIKKILFGGYRFWLHRVK